MKKLLLSLAFAIFSFIAFNQQIISSPSVEVQSTHEADWQVYVQHESFKIEYKFVNCDPAMGYDNESVLLRVTNLTGNKIQLTWINNNFYDKVCNSCNYPNEYFNELSLAPNQQLEGACDIYADKKLKIFSKFNDVNYSKGKQLTSFKLADLTIITY